MFSKCRLNKGIQRQYLAAVSACLGVLTSSSCYGWMTPIFDHLLEPDSEIPMTPEQAPWVVSLIDLGKLITPLPAGFLVNYIGRKPVILATGPLYIISWIIIIMFPSAFVLGICRAFQGFAQGFMLTAGPVYLGEIASKSSRGAVTSVFYLSWWVGYLIEFAVGPFLSLYHFTYFTLALNIPFIVFFSFQPESPYYFVMSGKEEKAREVLRYFREVTPEELEDELLEIKQNISASASKTRIRDLVENPEDRRVLVLLLVLTSVKLLTGIGVICNYATDIFNLTPNLPIPSSMITIVVGVVTLVGGFVGTITSDTLGRRPLLLISCMGSTICQFFTATYFLLQYKTSVDVSRFSWTVPVSILIFSGITTAGMFPVCSAYTSELFNTQTRGVASSLSVMAVTLCTFLELLAYQPVTYNFGIYINFYFFSFCGFVGTVYFYFTAPETKGKSFTDIRKEICNTNSNNIL